MLLDILVELKKIKKSINYAEAMWKEENDYKNFPIKSMQAKDLVILINEVKPIMSKFISKLNDIKTEAERKIL